MKVDFVDGTNGDFDRANAKMRQADPKWKQPPGYTWNHVGPNGSTELELVKTDFHERISHKGPAVSFRGTARAMKIIGRAGAVFNVIDFIMLAEYGDMRVEDGPYIFGDRVSGEYLVREKHRTWDEIYNNRPLHYLLTGESDYVPSIEYQLQYLSRDRTSVIAVENITYDEYQEHLELYYHEQGKLKTFWGRPMWFEEGTKRKQIFIWGEGLFGRESPVGWVDKDGVHFFHDEGFFDFLDELDRRASIS